MSTVSRSTKSGSKLIFFILLLGFAGSSTQRSLGQEVYEVASLSLQGYAPTRVLISFMYTNNFSVTDISSLGQSLYKISSGPTSIEFKAEDIDRYTFNVHLSYGDEVAQSIQIATFSSTWAPEGIQFNVKGKDIVLRFVLTVTKEPMYPSPEEVAEHVVLQVSNQLMEFESRMDEVLTTQNRNVETQWIVVAVSLTINFILILVFVLFVRRGKVEVSGG